jgi:hypothetical protein
MNKINNFSIRTNLIRQSAFKRPKTCMYICHVSKLIRPTLPGESSYTDSYYQCNKRQCRISGKAACQNCTMYKPLDYNNENDN